MPKKKTAETFVDLTESGVKDGKVKVWVVKCSRFHCSAFRPLFLSATGRGIFFPFRCPDKKKWRKNIIIRKEEQEDVERDDIL